MPAPNVESRRKTGRGDGLVVEFHHCSSFRRKCGYLTCAWLGPIIFISLFVLANSRRSRALLHDAAPPVGGRRVPHAYHHTAPSGLSFQRVRRRRRRRRQPTVPAPLPAFRVSREFLKQEMEAVRAERKACQEQLSQHAETSRALQVGERGGRENFGLVHQWPRDEKTSLF